MPDIKPLNKEKSPSSIENIVGGSKVPLNLLGSPTQQMDYHPHTTDGEPKMRWDADGTGHIDMGGGAMVQGGYSISLNPNGENSVEFYRD